MQKPATLNWIFNGVALLLGVTLVLYIAHSAFVTTTTAPCRERYPAPIRFSLASSDGALLTPIELQARVGQPEWGMAENAKVIAEGPVGTALEVKLAPVTNAEPKIQRTTGVNFRWRPSGMNQATSACLVYSVWLPEGFPFNDGGLMPGIYGGVPSGSNEPNQKGLGSRLKWRPDGVAELETASSDSEYVTLNQKGYALPHGRWTHVQQEIVLNTPGAADGAARLWLDGELAAEDTALTFRKDAKEIFAGVLANIGYLREPGSTGLLRFSPFEIAWR
jgi:hypothetical protein